MKIKICFNLIITLVVILFVSCDKNNETVEGKNVQRFLGTYYLEGTCEEYVSGGVFLDEREVTIKKGIETDLLINIGSLTSVDFNASVSNDSLYIPLQRWSNFDGTQSSFQGKGEIKNDTLFLRYMAGGSTGVVDCECKGGKEKTTYTGTIIDMPNPCTTVPCLPGILFGLETFYGNWVLSINSHWIWSDSELIVEDTEYFIGDKVKITGIISRKQDANSRQYTELEIQTMTKLSE